MHSWRSVLFFLLALLLLGGLSALFHRRVVSAFKPPRWLRTSLLWLLAAGVGAVLLGRSADGLSPAAQKALGTLGSLLTMGVLLSHALLLPYDVGRLLAALWRRLRRKPATTTAPEVGGEVSGRRAFMRQAAVGGAVSLGMGASAYGALLGRTDYALETVPIALSKLPRALDGFTIVQLSDLHVGTYVGESELGRALALVRRARPDIVVLTGDLVDHDPAYASVLGGFVQSLRELAPRGVYAIAGNHDYYAGVEQVLEGVRKAGGQVLLNRHVLVGDPGAQFALGGLDDVAAPRFGARGPLPVQTFAGVPEELARITLNHNPSFFPAGHKSCDLMLSGHTHGGQISLFVNPAQWVLRHGLIRGHYALGASQLYVNRGFGTAGPPVRIGSTPEVTKLVLTPG